MSLPAQRAREHLHHLLVVEDEDDIRGLIKITLELGGFRVTACDSGNAALEAVAAARPDLLLLDVMMPGLNGVDTYLEVQRLYAPPLPAIFLTARAQHAHIEEYLSTGALGVIAKPFNPLSLVEEIYALWTTGTASS